MAGWGAGIADRRVNGQAEADTGIHYWDDYASTTCLHPAAVGGRMEGLESQATCCLPCLTVDTC